MRIIHGPFSLFLLAALLLPLGCARIHSESLEGDQPISFSSVLDRPTQTVRHFETTRRQIFALWFLVPVREVNAIALAQDQLVDSDADGIVRLRIVTQLSPIDLATTALTVGLLGAWTVHIDGDLVRYSH